MQITHLDVNGMDCGGCENAIGKALAALDGVSSCSASFETGKVDVTYDPAKVELPVICKAIEDAGYEVATTI